VMPRQDDVIPFHVKFENNLRIKNAPLLTISHGIDRGNKVMGLLMIGGPSLVALKKIARFPVAATVLS
jgi:hypothetical protein